MRSQGRGAPFSTNLRLCRDQPRTATAKASLLAGPRGGRRRSRRGRRVSAWRTSHIVRDSCVPSGRMQAVMACLICRSLHLPIPCSGSLVMLRLTVTLPGLATSGNSRPPAKARLMSKGFPPPGAVWHSTQCPNVAR